MITSERKKLLFFIFSFSPCLLFSGFCYIGFGNVESMVLIVRAVGALLGLLVVGLLYYLYKPNVWLLLNMGLLGLALAFDLSRSLFRSEIIAVQWMLITQLVWLVCIGLFHYLFKKKTAFQMASEPELNITNSFYHFVFKSYHKTVSAVGLFSVLCLLQGVLLFMEEFRYTSLPICSLYFSITFIIFTLLALYCGLINIAKFLLIKPRDINMKEVNLITVVSIALLSLPLYFFPSDVLSFLFVCNNRLFLGFLVIAFSLGEWLFLRRVLTIINLPGISDSKSCE